MSRPLFSFTAENNFGVVTCCPCCGLDLREADSIRSARIPLYVLPNGVISELTHAPFVSRDPYPEIRCVECGEPLQLTEHQES